MSEEIKKQTIHEALKEAFDKINEQHNVRLEEVTYDYSAKPDGSVSIISILHSGESV